MLSKHSFYVKKEKNKQKQKQNKRWSFKKNKEGKTIEIIIFSKAKRFTLTDKNLISVKYYIVNFDVVIEYKML